MAVKLIATIQRYHGLSIDEKPMPTSTQQVSEGSTFHEVDTGLEYVFYNGIWEQDLRRIAALRAV